MADYKVELGVGLNDAQLNSIKNTINTLVDKERKINLDIDFTIKNANKLTEVGKEIEGIKKQLKELNDVGSIGKGKSPISINSESLEKSINKINNSIKKLQNAFGRVDGNKGVQSLLTTVSKIGKELESVSKQFSNLNKNLTSLSSKDLSFNLDFGLGSNKKDPTQLMRELRVLEKEAREYENYFYKVLNKTNKIDEIEARNSIYHLADRVGEYNSKNYILQLDRIMTTGTDANKIAAYKEYIRVIKELDSIGKYGATSVVEARLGETNNFVKLKNEANEAKETLKELFSGGISAEKLHQALDDIVVDLRKIQESISEASKGISFDGLTATFDKLSNSIELLVKNCVNMKVVINDSLGDIGGNVGGIGLENTEQDLKQATSTAKKSAEAMQYLRDSLSNMKVKDANIDGVVADLKGLGIEISNVTTRKTKDGINVSVKGIDDLGRVVTLVRQFDKNFSAETIAQSFETSADKAKEFKKEITSAFQDIKSAKKEIGNLELDLIKETDLKKIESINNRIKQLQSTIDNNMNVYGDYLTKRQKSALESIDKDFDFKKQQAQIELDIKLDDDVAKADFEKLKSLAKEISNIKIDIFKSNDAAEIDKAEAKLEGLINEYNELYAKTKLADKQSLQLDSLVDQSDIKVLNEFVKLQERMANTRFEIGKLELTGGKENEIAVLTKELEKIEDVYNRLKKTFMEKVSFAPNFDDVSVIENGITNSIEEAEKMLERFKSKLADIKAEAAKSIKLDIELGNYDNQISQMDSRFNRLSAASDELCDSVEEVKRTYREMENIMSDSSGDEAADIERLTKAQEKYAAALEKTNNLLRIQERADKTDNDRQRLEDKKTALDLKMTNWLKENSRAAKDYGEQIETIRRSLKGLDEVHTNAASRTFDNLTREAKAYGKTGLTVFDQLKVQFKKYASYLSAAEVFMYAEQALRSMFEQVKLVDAAMTELKKVTDESDASYAQFLDNAATRAKEIGTTIDGLVSSTSDFARLGYGFEESQKLAEVANIYAVVGDEIDGVEGATESLVSTLAAFKHEMNGLSDSDFALSIVDKMNEVANNYAISSGGLGEALKRSASSMAAANNSLDETIALITAANEVVQNPEKVGNAMKTISMRMKNHCPQ